MYITSWSIYRPVFTKYIYIIQLHFNIFIIIIFNNTIILLFKYIISYYYLYKGNGFVSFSNLNPIRNTITIKNTIQYGDINTPYSSLGAVGRLKMNNIKSS